MAGVAIVTGAGRNLGRHLVLALARQGFDVVVNTRSALAQAESVAREVESLGVRALPVLADVTDPDAVRAMVRRATDLGPLRVLVNNASLRRNTPVGDMTFDEWCQVRAITLDGAFHCVSAALPALTASGHGRIINIIGGNALRGDSRRVHVSAAKHGLIGMTRALASACAADGITANAVSPGNMNADTEVETARRRDRVAETVAFLASPAASDITGQLIEVGPTR